MGNASPQPTVHSAAYMSRPLPPTVSGDRVAPSARLAAVTLVPVPEPRRSEPCPCIPQAGGNLFPWVTKPGRSIPSVKLCPLGGQPQAAGGTDVGGGEGAPEVEVGTESSRVCPERAPSNSFPFVCSSGLGLPSLGSFTIFQDSPSCSHHTGSVGISGRFALLTLSSGQRAMPQDALFIF